MTPTIEQAELRAQLVALGVEPGDLLLVHTAYSQVGPVQGGPEGFITALQTAVGPRGTLMMPSMADDDELFDVSATPCQALGVVAHAFWRLPGVQRSDNPHAFAARGPLAPALLATHPVVIPHGIDSPAGRAIAMGGKVLLAGVGHHANTTIHVAENEAGVGYGFEARSVVRQSGVPVELRYREVDHCGRGFERVGEALQRTGLQRRGPLGRGQGILSTSSAIFDAALKLLREDQEALLCEAGGCNFCDAARKGYRLRFSARTPARPRPSSEPL